MLTTPLTALRLLALAAVLAAALAGCGSSSQSPPPVSARLVSQHGQPHGVIVLTAVGAERIGVTTAVVRAAAAPPTPRPAPPVTVERLTSTRTAASVTAAKPAPAHAPARSPGVLVPASAIVYSPAGQTMTFRRLSPLHFAEQPVQVIRFEGGQVLLGHGLRAGNQVVSVGAEELFGVQNGVLAQT